MKRDMMRKVATLLIGAALLAGTAGCERILLGGQVVSFIAGWALGGATTPTTVERECYQNGVQIDCADLPANIGQ